MQESEDAFYICEKAMAVADGLGGLLLTVSRFECIDGSFSLLPCTGSGKVCRIELLESRKLFAVYMMPVEIPSGTFKYGIPSAAYAKSLAEISCRAMENLINESKESTWTPRMAVEFAHSQVSAQGASTLCLLAFDAQQSILHAGKIGDGGYVVLRPMGSEEMEVVSPWKPFANPSEHPLGLKSTNYLSSQGLSRQIRGCHPRTTSETRVAVQEGDIIVLATDGLFDVVYFHGDEGALLRKQIRRLNAEPRFLAEQLCDLARQLSNMHVADCPMCHQALLLHDAGTAAGVLTDDIAVVVAHVVRA